MSDSSPAVVAVLGGTGDLGSGLVRFLARQKLPVVIGSRDAARAASAADDAVRDVPGADIRGTDLASAARAGDVVFLAVPYAAQRDTLHAIRDDVQGKIVVNTTVPLRPPKILRVQLPPDGSAAVESQILLGAGVRVVAALHNVAGRHLASGHEVDCDVLVSGDDERARQTLIDLLAAGGIRAWHSGPLANAAASEALTSVLIGINRRYRIAGAGIRITGQTEGAT